MYLIKSDLKLNICFTSPLPDVYSETFISSLKSNLDAKIFHCYGDFFPFLSLDSKLQDFHSTNLLDKIKYHFGLISFPLKEYYLIKYFKQNEINLIFANYGPSGALLAPLALKSKIPLIVHFHGFDASIHEVLRKYHHAYQQMFTVAKAIIVVSEEMKSDLIALGAPAEKLFKITYSPSSLFLKVTPDYQSSQVLAIGRFVEKKAPYLTILAFQKAKEKCPDLVLKFIGAGDLMSVCQDLCKALNLDDVHFAGILSPKEIATEMSRSFCFIQHSKQAANGDKEGTPVAILEAMAAGLPVISTRHAGIPDVIIDGKNGYLVAEGDVLGMGEKLVDLAHDRNKVAEFGHKGKEIVSKNFNPKEYIEKMNRLIKISTAVD